jgi:tight adherence protein C
MSLRVDLSDLRSVVNALVQADELGVSIGTILRVQADQIRQRRFERAEKLANEAPVKMLFPLLFFIFPAVFLVLLGPVLYRLARQGF